jgi:hypothetical protein
MKRNQILKIVSFAVAVLLGLVSAQTAIGAGIPAYATPTAQAQIGQAYTSQLGLGVSGAASTAANTGSTTPASTTTSTPVNAWSPAGQMQISQNMAS